MFYLGSRLRDYRQKVAPEITQEEFAFQVNISPSKLSKIENNKAPLTMYDIALITLQYKDLSIYRRYIDVQEKFLFGCVQEQKLISV